MQPNKELIKESISYFGHLLPLNKKVNNYQFARLINDNYSLLNPITRKLYSAISKSIDLKYIRLNAGVRVTRI